MVILLKKQSHWKELGPLLCNGEVISLNSGEKTQNQTVTIPAHSAMILYQE